MHPFFETIDIQEVTVVLDRLAETFEESSEEFKALDMARFALFDGGHEKLKRIYDHEKAALRSAEEAAAP